MHVAILTLDGFHELDSLIALGVYVARAIDNITRFLPRGATRTVTAG